MIALRLIRPWFMEGNHGLLALAVYNRHCSAGVSVQGLAQYIEASSALLEVHCESQQTMVLYNELLL